MFCFIFKDRNVNISKEELDTVCNAGNIITGLIFGEQNGIGQKHTPNLHVFEQFSHIYFNIVRSIVKDSEHTLPLGGSGVALMEALRDFADTFGGFDCVDKWLQKHQNKRHMQEYIIQATSAQADHENMYDWYVIPFGLAGPLLNQETKRLQDEGYVYISVSDDLYHFRRERASLQHTGAETGRKRANDTTRTEDASRFKAE